MKILGINKADIYYLPKHEGVKKTYTTHNPITRPQSLNFYQPVNFKGSDKIDKYTLIDKGYEEVTVNNNGKVGNKSKFLIISNAEQLSAVTKSPDMEDKYFVLVSDIDMNGVDFKPIGSYDKPFKGNFDGNGFSVNNLTIDSQEYDSGFFSFTEGAKISNLDLQNIKIIAKNEAGGLIANAANTEVDNCSVNGTISGELNIGGLIGVSENNKINHVKVSGILKPIENISNNFLFDYNNENENRESLVSACGGLIGADEASKINDVYSDMEILTTKDSGGIIGMCGNFYCIPTEIKNAWFDGKIQRSDSCGEIVGNGINVRISQCLSLNNNPIGQNTNCMINDCISDIKDISQANFEKWDKQLWDIRDNHTIPRLKSIKNTKNLNQIFLEDVNTARTLGFIPNSSEKYTQPEYVEVPLEIKPPKHYDKNNELINQIRQSTDKNKLLEWFYIYSDTYTLDCLSTDEYDEILLELVKNKHLDVNYIYHFKNEFINGLKESIMCHPLYVCSRLKKPYIYREMLKRDDINLYKLCGCRNDTDTFKVMQTYGDDSSAYVLYSSKNPKVQTYLAKKVAEHNSKKEESSSKLVNLMNKYYPEIFEYDETKEIINIPTKYFSDLRYSRNQTYDSNNNFMNSIDDVMRNMDVSPNYTDSNGNNIINLAAAEENELYALSMYKKALIRGTVLTNKNNNGETPADTLIRTGKNQYILADILNQLNPPFITNDFGEDAIHIFTKNDNENVGISHIEKALNAGLSVNTIDNFGTTPLMNAIERKHNNMVKFLIQNGADVNICDNNGLSPLHYACINCEGITDLDIIYTLINRNANTKVKDANGLTPFDYLSDEIKTIINMSPDEYKSFRESSKNQPEIYTALTTNAIQYDAHTKLLENSNISEESSKEFKSIPLPKKRMTPDIIVKNLINGTNIDESLLQLKFILNRCAFPYEFETFEYQNTLLHVLMGTNSPITKECIKLLCKKYNVNVDAQNCFNETPLMAAIDNYQLLNSARDKLICIDNIFTLLDFSPNVNILDENKQNVLHRICQSDCAILLIKFLELNSNINQKDILGKNPIEYLSDNALNKMRKYYENYALNKKLKLNITESLKRIL